MERPTRTPSPLAATAACAALLGLFVALSWLAAGQNPAALAPGVIDLLCERLPLVVPDERANSRL